MMQQRNRLHSPTTRHGARLRAAVAAVAATAAVVAIAGCGSGDDGDTGTDGARPLDTAKAKQFRKGLAQLNEEGVVQVLKDPDWGDASPVLAAVGQLQFDVFANRLEFEFNAPIEISPASYQAIRVTDKESADVLRQKPGVRILARFSGDLVALFENKYALQRIEQNEPELRLDPIVAT